MILYIVNLLFDSISSSQKIRRAEVPQYLLNFNLAGLYKYLLLLKSRHLVRNTEWKCKTQILFCEKSVL